MWDQGCKLPALSRNESYNTFVALTIGIAMSGAPTDGARPLLKGTSARSGRKEVISAREDW
jgi:hypothetical protein